MTIVKTAPDALKMLWKDGFFEVCTTLSDIEAELSSKGYHFGDATRKAAYRANFLTISGTRGKRTFIQRHPYDEEGDEKHEKS